MAQENVLVTLISFLKIYFLTKVFIYVLVNVFQCKHSRGKDREERE